MEWKTKKSGNTYVYGKQGNYKPKWAWKPEGISMRRQVTRGGHGGIILLIETYGGFHKLSDLRKALKQKIGEDAKVTALPFVPH